MELSEFLVIVRTLAAIAPFADGCPECEELEFTWPYAGKREASSLRGKYRCKNGHQWECTYQIEPAPPSPPFKSRPSRKEKEADLDLKEILSVPVISGSRVRGSRSIPQSVKIAVAVRDEGRCVYCGSIERLQYDHVIPWSKGGDSSVDNIQLLCGSHNASKRDKMPDD
jgi:hypothetical protein